MASATGIPDQNPASRGGEENEPLLGEPGDASQKSEKGIQFNFIIGRFKQHRSVACLLLMIDQELLLLPRQAYGLYSSPSQSAETRTNIGCS